MAADKVPATNNQDKGFFHKLEEKQASTVKWYGDKLVLVEKWKLTNLAIHNKDREVEGKTVKADSTALKVAKFIGSLLAALPVLALFGAATLVHKAGTFLKDLFKCNGTEKKEKTSEEEEPSEANKSSEKGKAEENKSAEAPTPPSGPATPVVAPART